MAFLTRGVVSVFALGCLLGPSEIAAAETPLRGARVVWIRGDRVYVASPDSVAPGLGTILTFKDRGKKVAAAEVTAVHDGELVAAKLTSGSLAKVKHLERLEIATEPPVFRSPPILRVGYPAPGRKNYLFDCRKQFLSTYLRHRTYRMPVDSMVTTGPTYRLLRETQHSGTDPWPDTLLIRLFDDSADEEIALERGDLDVAVFWPGEASAHIREVTGWTSRSGGIGARGRLLATVRQPYRAVAADTLRDGELRALERLAHELFRGDLQPAPEWTGPSTSGAPGRFEVDGSLPGRETMELLLNRGAGAGAPADTTRIVDLNYQETRPAVPVPASTRGEYWLGVRCPVISGPKLWSYLNAIDIEVLENLFYCLPAAGKP